MADAEPLGLHKYPKVEMVARTLAAAYGLHPEAQATKSALWETPHGLKVLPPPSDVRPAWQFFVPEAELIVANIDAWDRVDG